MLWTIQFLEDAPNLDEAATSAQARTYRAIKEALAAQETVTVGEILDRLELSNPKCLFSRLEHLEEKGFLKLTRKETLRTA